MNKNKSLKVKDCEHIWYKFNYAVFCRNCGTFLKNMHTKGFTELKKNLVEVELI